MPFKLKFEGMDLTIGRPLCFFNECCKFWFEVNVKRFPHKFSHHHHQHITTTDIVDHSNIFTIPTTHSTAHRAINQMLDMVKPKATKARATNAQATSAQATKVDSAKLLFLLIKISNLI